MREEEATRRSTTCNRVNGSSRTYQSISDWEQGTLVAGLLLAISFGLMFVIGAII